MEAISVNLTELVKKTVQVPDQNIDNLRVIIIIMQETGRVFSESLSELDPDVIMKVS